MPSTLNSIAVFCGSRFGKNPLYKQTAHHVGQTLAKTGIRLVYGGGAHGLMGVVADATLAAGGMVTGVIPDFLESREKMHEGVAELIVTDSMHSRKRIMFSRADAFWILPGGFGTFDEMMEILTWKQLGRHNKPIILINVDNWADMLLAALDSAVEQGFAAAAARAMIQAVPDVESALLYSQDAEKSVRVPVEQL